MSLKTNVTVKVGRSVLRFKQNSPALMFGIGIGTMVGTVILASKATLQLESVLDKHEGYTDRESAKAHKMALAVDITKLYAPAAALGVISVGTLTGSHVVLSKRNAALTAAYAALDKTYREYRDRVREEFGDEKERQVHFDIDEKSVVRDGTTGKALSTTGIHGKSIYARFFDQMCRDWSPEPEYNRMFLSCQQNYLNDLLHARGHVFLNEAYDRLGIPRSKAGNLVGWVVGNGDNYVDFGIFDKTSERARAFVNGQEGAILLDFNVDGVVLDLIEEKS